MSDHYFATSYGFSSPRAQPRQGFYHPALGGLCSLAEWQAQADPERPAIGVMFYRAHYLSSNTAFLDALVHEIEAQGGSALPFFVSGRNGLAKMIRDHGLGVSQPLDVLISTVSYDMSPDEDQQRRWAGRSCILDAHLLVDAGAWLHPEGCARQP
ncbi:MAG: cobaltochelatase subunit CobN [Anaerolineae bacterium]|nr:cobaltochelatase subunit CobN [Anaerolineae bacterium]